MLRRLGPIWQKVRPQRRRMRGKRGPRERGSAQWCATVLWCL